MRWMEEGEESGREDHEVEQNIGRRGGGKGRWVEKRKGSEGERE